MSNDSANRWASMSGTLAGAVDCAIVYIQCNNVPRALELLLEAQAQWDQLLESNFPRVIPTMVQE